MSRLAAILLLATAAPGLAAAETGRTPGAAPNGAPVPISPYVVTAARGAWTVDELATPVDLFSGPHLRDQPGATLDAALRAAPAFSLFRRTDSLSAHPTTQGVSLRGLGPSGASRSLVLLDGIPLNDPFGGWVAWQKVPRLDLQGVEIVHGGGSGLWGSGALGGVVQVLTEPPAADAGAARATLGTSGLRAIEFAQGFAPPARPAGPGSSWRLGGRWFATDGDFAYARAQRGPIDRRLDSRHLLANLDYAHTFASGAELRAGLRGFDEDRGNGTPLQRNRSREYAAQAGLTLHPDFADRVAVSAYAQQQRFASGFSSVDDTRGGETPALDQFRVPARAWGAAVVAEWDGAAGGRTVAGLDARAVRGETREDFFYAAGAFQRRRVAGGRQFFGGVFAERMQRWRMGPRAVPVNATLSARLDTWRNTDGRRTEFVKGTGAVLRDDRFPDRTGTEFSPALGVVVQPGGGLRIRGAVYRAFRVPTLNELHRPFRVGNVATEANPALGRETLAGWDLQVEGARGPWHASAGLFGNRLHDAVTNVTLSTSPALTQRQRLSVDAIDVSGAEAVLRWAAGDRLSLTLRYLFNRTRVVAATVAPDLVGRRLAQVPRHVATLAGEWRPGPGWTLTGLVRASSAQFDDDENQLRLPGFVTCDLALRRQFGTRADAGLAVENVFAATIVSARTAQGLLTRAGGRRARVDVTWHW